MSNNADTEACAVLMKSRCTAKNAHEHIKACVDMHNCNHVPHNDRTDKIFMR